MIAEYRMPGVSDPRFTSLLPHRRGSWYTLHMKDNLRAIKQAFKNHPDFQDIEIVRDIWMIHFTNQADAIKISEEGFTKGSPIDGFLAHTFGAEQLQPGANFSFESGDEYAMMLLSGFDFGSDIESAVMFRGSAVRMQHYDEFYQCAFWGPSTKGPFHILNTENDSDIEPHERLWTIASTQESGGLFDMMGIIEAAQPKTSPSPRSRRP